MTPIPGQTVSLPAKFMGIWHDDYYRIQRVTGTHRRSVFVIRHGTRRRYRIGLQEFNRRASRAVQSTKERT